MPETKVVEILGAPKETIGTADDRLYGWESQGKYSSVSFGERTVVDPTAHADRKDYVLEGIHESRAGNRRKPKEQEMSRPA